MVCSRDLDLEGAPYGYTPFCDSNKDMEGFRFWKQVWFQSYNHTLKENKNYIGT